MLERLHLTRLAHSHTAPRCKQLRLHAGCCACWEKPHAFSSQQECRTRVPHMNRAASQAASPHLDQARQRSAGQVHQIPQVQHVCRAGELAQPPRVRAHEALVEQLAFLACAGRLSASLSQAHPSVISALLTWRTNGSLELQSTTEWTRAWKSQHVLAARACSDSSRLYIAAHKRTKPSMTSSLKQKATARCKLPVLSQSPMTLSERPTARWKSTNSSTSFQVSGGTCGKAR